MSRLSVSETFYSIQGEGKTAGVPSVFLRLSGCNLMCGGLGTEIDGKLHNGATWRCDTIEVWMQKTKVQFESVLNQSQIQRLKNGAHLIITGGEPLLHQKSIQEYLDWLSKWFIPKIEIETNGTIIPKLKAPIQYNVSPKLSNSGNEFGKIYKPDAITHFNDKEDSFFKFVVSNYKDWKEIEKYYLPIIDKSKVWLMPAGSSQEELNQTRKLVADLCVANEIQYSPRLHVEIWNQKTGV